MSENDSELLVANAQNYPSAVLQKIKQRLDSFGSGFSDNTNRARHADFKIYQSWCEQQHFTPLPATPDQIEQFLWDMVAVPKVNKDTGEVELDKQGKPVLIQVRCVATIERYLATLKYLHEVSHEIYTELTLGQAFDPEKYRNPADTRQVRIALKAIKRRFRTRPQRQAAPVRLDVVERVINEFSDSLRDTLYKCLISVGFDTMLRCSELVNIHVDHVQYHDDGSGSVFIPFHKSDQLGEGSYRYLSAVSVRLIHDWCTMAQITSGPLFRSIAKGNRVLPMMNKDRVGRIYKEIAFRLGVKADRISAHSTRVGAAQELLASGTSLPELMLAGDWKSPAMPVRYARQISIQTGAMASFSKNRGRG